MTINWWTVGLQAINVIILVWLLTRFFWRPVSEAITKRQDAQQTLMSSAKASQTEADRALAEVTATREGMSTEREALLASAIAKAQSSAQAILAEGSVKADDLLAAARLTAKRETETTRAKTLEDASLLSLDIARKLLVRLDAREVQGAFLSHLVKAIEDMNPKDRAALANAEDKISLVSPKVLVAAEKTKVSKAVRDALGGKFALNFVTDPELIAGFEMRTAHFVLRASWQSDLAVILKELENAA